MARRQAGAQDPHVFGDVTVSGADEVTQNWDAIKAAEREAGKGGGSPGSAFDGAPLGQPALSLAAQLRRRAERVRCRTSLAELSPARRSAIGAEPSWVARPRAAGLDPELEPARPPVPTATGCSPGRQKPVQPG
jgi:XTP/dITP diphosphohydrolase